MIRLLARRPHLKRISKLSLMRHSQGTNEYCCVQTTSSVAEQSLISALLIISAALQQGVSVAEDLELTRVQQGTPAVQEGQDGSTSSHAGEVHASLLCQSHLSCKWCDSLGQLSPGMVSAITHHITCTPQVEVGGLLALVMPVKLAPLCTRTQYPANMCLLIYTTSYTFCQSQGESWPRGHDPATEQIRNVASSRFVGWSSCSPTTRCGRSWISPLISLFPEWYPDVFPCRDKPFTISKCTWAHIAGLHSLSLTRAGACSCMQCTWEEGNPREVICHMATDLQMVRYLSTREQRLQCWNAAKVNLKVFRQPDIALCLFKKCYHGPD